MVRPNGASFATLFFTMENPCWLIYLSNRLSVEAKDYYLALSKSDKEASSTPFVEFMLKALQEAMREIVLSLIYFTQSQKNLI